MDSKLLKETSCRTCMALSENRKDFVPIFKGPFSCRTSRAEIFEQIKSFDLGVDENDGLPQIICPKCIEELDSIVQFRKRCLDVQNELRTYFEENPPIDDAEIGNQLENKQDEQKGNELDIEQEENNDGNEETEEVYQTDDSYSEIKNDPNENVMESKCDVSEDEDENWECEYYIASDDVLDYLNACAVASKRVWKRKETDPKSVNISGTENEDLDKSGKNLDEAIGNEDEENNQYYIDDEMIEVSFEVGSSNGDDENKNIDYYNEICHTTNDTNKTTTAEKSRNSTKRCRYNCKYCEEGFVWVVQLNNHLTICPKRNTVNCDICTVEFETQELFEKHTQIFHPFGGPPMCPICSRTFEDTKKRNLHMYMSHTTREECECNVCGKVFMSKLKLSNHKRRSHIIGDHECPVCMKKFKFTHAYQAHMKTHVKNFKCQHCDKTFISESKAKIHERIHTRDRVHLCSFCGMTFKTGSDLNQHFDSHNNERKFKCPQCTEHFFTRRQLRSHIKINHEATRYPCDLCGKLFRKEQMPVHKYAAHNAEKPPSREPNKTYLFNCPICSKGFLTASSLLFHSKIHTEDRKHVCSECGSRYKRADHLQLHIKRIHLKIKNHACDVCGKRYLEKNQLKSHMQIHQTIRPFKCTECPCDFKTQRALQVHNLRHTGETPHACGICDSHFANRRLLLVHTLTHTQEQMKEIELVVASSFGPKKEKEETEIDTLDEQLQELMGDD